MQARRAARFLIPLLVLAGLGGVGFALVSPREGYKPPQPIYFQHARMAGAPVWYQDEKGRSTNLGGFDIPCVYCHTMAYKGRHATLPSTDICMNCHATVGQNREWVLVLKKYWDEGRPIPWAKVHDLPDFVYFDHSAHLNARDKEGRNKVECRDCHGEVQDLDVVQVKNRFSMGWCLECHRKPEKAAPTDCVTCHR